MHHAFSPAVSRKNKYRLFLKGLCSICLLSFSGCNTPLSGGFLKTFNHSDTPRRLNPKQIIPLDDADYFGQIEVDELGDGLIFYRGTGKTKSLVFQNYAIQPNIQSMAFSQSEPIVLWGKAGQGEILFLSSTPFYPRFGPGLPSDKKRIPLAFTLAHIKDYQVEGTPQRTDDQQTGVAFLSPALQLDSTGKGHLSGLLYDYNQVLARKSLEAQYTYRLAYLNIQDFHFQPKLNAFEIFESRDTPSVWLKDDEGLLLYKNEDNTWALKEIHKNKIADEEIPVPISSYDSEPPVPTIDLQGNGFVVSQSAKQRFNLHTIKNLKYIKSTLIEVPEDLHASKQWILRGEKGVLVSYASTRANAVKGVEITFSRIKDLKITRTYTYSYTFPANAPESITDVSFKSNAQGKGLLLMFTQPESLNRRHMYLFPIRDDLPE